MDDQGDTIDPGPKVVHDNDLEASDKLKRIISDARRMSGRWARAGNGIDHDDIAQTVAIYQWQRGDTEKVNFATVRSRSIDALRSLRRRREAEADCAAHQTQVLASETNDVEQVSSDNEHAKEIVGMLFQQASLDLTTETILYQHFAESFTLNQIALIWGFRIEDSGEPDEHLVKRTIVNGLDKLRRVLWTLR